MFNSGSLYSSPINGLTVNDQASFMSTMDNSGGRSPFMNNILRDYDDEFRQQVFGDFDSSAKTTGRELIKFKDLE